MSYCINPECLYQNPDACNNCQRCGTPLSILERYRLVKPLRKGGHRNQIFEADDCENQRVILKVLTTETPTNIAHYEREVNFLRKMRDQQRIPKLIHNFLFVVPQGHQLRCLVMEKIEGQNLEEWIETSGPISEDIALNYLLQIVEILQLLHNKKFFHRDIKPENIMRKPNGELVLIDYGSIREYTPENSKQTKIWSEGYGAPEQADGKGVPQSDFFGLARTMVYCLTSIHVEQLQDSQTGNLIWRDRATVSRDLADFIDKLMAPSVQDRPQSIEIIHQHLSDLKISLGNELAPQQLPNPQNKAEGHLIGNMRQLIPVLRINKILSGLALLGIISIFIYYYIDKYFKDSKIYKMKITTEDKINLCKNSDYYLDKIYKLHKQLFLIEAPTFTFKELKNDDSLTTVIPAFRQRCYYSYEWEGKNELPEGGSPGLISIGLDMSKPICEKKYGHEGFIMAIPLHYDRSDSIHCVLTREVKEKMELASVHLHDYYSVTPMSRNHFQKVLITGTIKV